ncbi:MAG: histidinol-phosphate transaminase [Firmicutes bacterium]|nr:histidinol-phosphate transaminase [Bacillota bacterium]
MSRFLSNEFESLKPYVPGEQPRDKAYIKLNTNELPFPPSPIAQRLARAEAGDLRLYPDPDCYLLRQVASEYFSVEPDEIFFGNGSDDVLNYAFMAFGGKGCAFAFPDITYSFYKVLADLNRTEYTEIPVKDDFSIDPSDYFALGKTIVIANPNAPTGIALPVSSVEEILKANPDNVVIIDEAYVFFGAESCLPLIRKYDNLLIVGTLSKANALAGGRLGYAIGNKELILDLNRLKNSLNPYCINRMTMMAGVGVLSDRSYTESCCKRIMTIRDNTFSQLKDLGFTGTDSIANFLFVKHPDYEGKKLYTELRDRGILVRHFDTEKLRDYIRVSIGDEEDMNAFINAIKELVGEVI